MRHTVFGALFLLSGPGLMSATAETEEPAETKSPYEVGLEAQDAERYREARTAFRTACTSGEAKACSAYGRLLRHGQGGLQDEAASERFYIRGCEGGDVVGCATLGFLYNYGFKGEPNYPASRKYYQIACTGGEVSACAALGNQQYAGIGGPINRTSGKRLMREACAAEFEWACNQLRQLGLSR